MQELAFPLKIHVRRNGKRVIFVEHTQYGRYVSTKERELQDQTRAFCNWIRTTFPDLPTEYRTTTSGWREPADRHFVAYDVTPKEFMMIKLAFGFKTIDVRFSKKKIWRRRWWSDNSRYRDEEYTPGYLARFNVHPTTDLLARMAKKPGKYRTLTRNRQNH